jgi:hypothetical protein
LVAGLHPGTKVDARFQSGMKRRGACSHRGPARNGKIPTPKSRFC